MTYPKAKVYGSRLIHESGLGLNSKVAAVIVNNEWCWPNLVWKLWWRFKVLAVLFIL
jgi:hypothetical protein